MRGLHEQLQSRLQGRVCVVGVGNVDAGDDAFGVRLAEELLKRSEGRGVKDEPPQDREAGSNGEPALRASFFPLHQSVLLAGMAPERFVGRLIDAGFDHVVFLDAVDCGGAPGSVVLLDSRQIAARFPQVSTHKISLGLLARCLEANGATRACLLGVQPQSLKPGADLTPVIQTTLHLLAGVLSETLRCAARPPALPGPQPAIA
jgi:hydrogenase maturation protease